MTLVDTSRWVDHLNRGDDLVMKLLEDDLVFSHPFVLGELAMGNLKPREPILRLVGRVRKITLARDEEVLQFVGENSLFGSGIGYIDAHLLAAVRLTPGTTLLTKDRRLHHAAESMGLAYQP